MKVKVSYKKNSKEKYTTYKVDLDAYEPFELIKKTLQKTDVEQLQIKIIKLKGA